MTLLINGGTIPGTDHIKAGKPGFTNNHDAYAWGYLENNGLIAVVCDGCGSGKHSEVGANLASQIITEVLKKEVSLLSKDKGLENLNWQRIKQLIIAPLSVIANAMGGSLSKVINDYFLFTIVGTIITKSEVLIFSFGDGVYILNEEVKELGPFLNNAPPYLMYNLVGSSLVENGSTLLDFQCEKLISRDELESLIIGTDGVMDFIQHEKSLLPSNLSMTVGAIHQFLEKKFFMNPDMINRKLRIINREYIDSSCIKSGLLPDDTTLIVIKDNFE